ncbi:MAG: glycosyl hydrolase 53 family protein [Chitinophagaceae bacterium]|nr:glycosyl hydrolase 53 family protein [Chitinophagaceae bacterium]
MPASVAKNLLAGLAFSFLLAASCNKDMNEQQPAKSTFAYGADVGWLTQMEAAGMRFYDSTGTATECMQLLKQYGMNAIRLRVWVNPAGGWNNTADVVAKAVRAKNLGMRVMIDFHYSDNWADPGQQTKPAAWASLDLAGMQAAVYDHTFNVLTALKTNGVTPEWVQVGNETNDGMLWPTGKASVNMAAFAALVKSGYDAVKAVNASSKVIVHISNGYDNNLYRWIFDGLQANGVKWDVIGMSLYPNAGDWQLRNDQCLANMNDMISRYGKEIMIAEVGMPWDEATACRAFIADIITKTKSLPANKGLGVFYWEPQSYNNWQGYTKGAFDNSGKPTVAMKAFLQ